jgi:hypothetical protein
MCHPGDGRSGRHHDRSRLQQVAVILLRQLEDAEYLRRRRAPVRAVFAVIHDQSEISGADVRAAALGSGAAWQRPYLADSSHHPAFTTCGDGSEQYLVRARTDPVRSGKKVI